MILELLGAVILLAACGDTKKDFYEKKQIVGVSRREMKFTTMTGTSIRYMTTDIARIVTIIMMIGNNAVL